MKLNILKWSFIALVPMAALVLASCKSEPKDQGASSEPKGQSASVATFEKGVPGGTIVQTHQATATVTAIEPETRKVTMVSPDGKKTTFKAGPEIANFDQIRVGDKVKATLTDELVVFVGDEARAQSDGARSTVALAPVGAKPGIYVADTVQVTAKVVAIDLANHKATLQFPDGSTKTVPVRKDVDLTQQKVGEDVVIRSTEAQAISVEKP